MLKSLLPHIDNINKLDEKNGHSAAHICAIYGELECLRILCMHGLDLTIADKFGCLPQHLAAKHNHARIVEFLYDYGCSFNRKCDQGKIPLHYACEYGSLSALKALSGYYIDLTMLDGNGMSPAHLACATNKLDCLKFMISMGFPKDKVLSANCGRNLAHTCCLYGSVDCLHWLLESKVNLRALDGKSLASGLPFLRALFDRKVIFDQKTTILSHICAVWVATPSVSTVSFSMTTKSTSTHQTK